MDRISELTRIARERDLTPEEQAERTALREEYLADWRRSTLAPILVIGGFIFEIYAILKRF